MFKVIGGVVLCGLALYGLVKYLERPMVRVVINATPHKEPAPVEEEVAAAPAVGDPVAEAAPDMELTPAAT